MVETDKHMPCIWVCYLLSCCFCTSVQGLLFSSEFLCSHLLYKMKRLKCTKLEIILFSVWVCNLTHTLWEERRFDDV